MDDEQWIRIVDVDAALAARTYNDANGSVSIAVTDRQVAGNNGVWAVDASGARRTHDEGDLCADISVISAAYLGGTAWHTLAAAGAVDVRNEKAVAIRGQPVCQPPAPVQRQFLLTPRDTCRVAVAWLHEAELVRRDHRVHTRPNVELEQHAGDV